MIDVHERCEWVNVSSGCSVQIPEIRKTVMCVCVCVCVYNVVVLVREVRK